MAENTHGVVLLDVEPGGEFFDKKILERSGHDVVVCHGPEMAHLCPLLGGKGCEMFDEAHGIVFGLNLERAQHRAILKRYQELGREDLPIRVVVSDEQAARFAPLLDDVQVWTHEPTVADLDGFAAEVEAADRYSS